MIQILASRVDIYSNAQNPDTGEVNVFGGNRLFYQKNPQQPETPIIFNGDVRDLLPTSVYNNLYNTIEAIVIANTGGGSNGGGGGDNPLFQPDVIKNLTEALATDIQNLAINTATSRVFDEFQANLTSPVALFDSDGNGIITTSDLLDFLTLFGSDTSGTSAADVFLPEGFTLESLREEINPPPDQSNTDTSQTLRVNIGNKLTQLLSYYGTPNYGIFAPLNLGTDSVQDYIDTNPQIFSQ